MGRESDGSAWPAGESACKDLPAFDLLRAVSLCRSGCVTAGLARTKGHRRKGKWTRKDSELRCFLSFGAGAAWVESALVVCITSTARGR
jgi:hypothetical protein